MCRLSVSRKDVTPLKCEGQFKPFVYLNRGDRFGKLHVPGSSRWTFTPGTKAGHDSRRRFAQIKAHFSGKYCRKGSDHAPCLHIQRIERMRACHEKAVFLRSSEGQVGAAFGKTDEADRLAFGIEHLHPVQFLALRVWRAVTSPATPQVAIGIDPETVDGSGAVGVDQL